MPKKLPRMQLQQWYQNFAQELYEKANIDVKRVEDLGRVKNFYITHWDETEPGIPQVESVYAYMPRRGRDYLRPAPDTNDFDAYCRWVQTNLNSDLTDEQIQELYDLSCAGTLMILDPTGDSMRQIHTREDGTIVTSLPMNDYDRGQQSDVPEDRRLPPEPVYVPEPDLETFGFANRPERPQRPENMNPSIWAYIGYLVGIRTDYRILMDYNEQMDAYLEQWNSWRKNLDRTQPEMMARFRTAVEERRQFQRDFEAYRANPLGLAAAIDRGCSMKAMTMDDPEAYRQFVKKEAQFLRTEHAKTPQGAIFEALTEVNQNKDRAKQAVRNMVGHDPEEASELTQEELQQSQANDRLYQLMRQGIESRKMLLEHALYRRNMKPAELQQAALNVMFAAHLEAEALLAHVKVPNAPDKVIRKNHLLDPQWVDNRKNALLECTELSKVKTMSREELGALFVDRGLQILKALSSESKRSRILRDDDLELELDEDLIQFIMG